MPLMRRSDVESMRVRYVNPTQGMSRIAAPTASVARTARAIQNYQQRYGALPTPAAPGSPLKAIAIVGGVIIVVGGSIWWFLRRRRRQQAQTEEE